MFGTKIVSGTAIGADFIVVQEYSTVQTGE